MKSEILQPAMQAYAAESGRKVAATAVTVACNGEPVNPKAKVLAYVPKKGAGEPARMVIRLPGSAVAA